MGRDDLLMREWGKIMRKSILALRSFVGLLRSGVAEISGLILLILTVLITLDAILRYLFIKSIPGTLEICRVSLVFIIFFALGQTQAKGEHIRVDFLFTRLPSKVKHHGELIIHLIALAFILFIFWPSIEFFKESLTVREYYQSGIRVPIYPAKAAILIGCGFMIIELVNNIFQLLAKKRRQPKKHSKT